MARKNVSILLCLANLLTVVSGTPLLTNLV